MRKRTLDELLALPHDGCATRTTLYKWDLLMNFGRTLANSIQERARAFRYIEEVICGEDPTTQSDEAYVAECMSNLWDDCEVGPL